METIQARTGTTLAHNGRKARTPHQHPSPRYGAPQGHPKAAIKAFCQQSQRCPDGECAYRVTGKDLAESMRDGTLLAFESHAADCVIYRELAQRGPVHPLWFLGFGQETTTTRKGKKA